MKKIYHANSNIKRAGIAILMSNKIDFKNFLKVTNDKEGHFIRRVNSAFPPENENKASMPTLAISL